jgi:hypothetical protein
MFNFHQFSPSPLLLLFSLSFSFFSSLEIENTGKQEVGGSISLFTQDPQGSAAQNVNIPM